MSEPAGPLSRRQWFRSAAGGAAAATLRVPPVWSSDTPRSDRRRVGPFECRADFPLEPYRGLLEDLSGLQSELVRTLGIRPASEPVEVYLFAGKAEYDTFLRRYYPELPYRQALFVKSGTPGRVLLYRHSGFDVDLRHECTHALLHASLPMVPLWLDEGLAEYFEMPPEKRGDGHPHLTAIRWSMRLGVMMPLETLEAKRNLSEMQRLEYRFAWGWVHFMLHGPQAAHGELVAFLRDIQAGVPPGKLSRRLAQRVPQLEARLVAHFKAWQAGSMVGLLTPESFR